MTSHQSKRLLVVDTDLGVDDALALLFLASRPDIEIVAVHSTHGNCRADQAADNARYVLELIGRDDIEVHRGLLQPLSQPLDVSSHIHGHDGLGNTGLTPKRRVEGEPTAVDNLLRLAAKHAGELNLVVLGPSTNVAAAAKKEPRLFDQLASVTIVGGWGPALFNDATPWRNRPFGSGGDPNVFHDPEAAQILASSGRALTWCGPNVTRQCVVEERRFIAVAERTRNPHAEFIAKISAFYSDFYSHFYSGGGTGARVMGINDSIAAAVFAVPDVVLAAVDRPVVIFRDDLGRACAAGVQTEPPQAGPKHRIISDVDFGRIIGMLLEMLERPLPRWRDRS